MRPTVVIPALNEAATLEATLASIPPHEGLEIVLADGGSTDGTAELAESRGARVVRGARGRGPQMNAGARAAGGDVLLFLHADTRLPGDAWEHVEGALEDERVRGGAFLLDLDAPGALLRLTSRNANVRSRVLGLPYGDQALFARRADFEALGGFRDLPWCEDLDFVRRLSSRGRVRVVPAAVRSSARRWLERGWLRTSLRNQVLFAKYWLGLIRER